mmetsp:Transcript_1526/g.4449  ORF Transcript_1526/g.4449 Transcript_1526/m.4449 type:complete len:216 (-) Transcript_1526:653-1300(-)
MRVTARVTPSSWTSCVRAAAASAEGRKWRSILTRMCARATSPCGPQSPRARRPPPCPSPSLPRAEMRTSCVACGRRTENVQTILFSCTRRAAAVASRASHRSATTISRTAPPGATASASPTRPLCWRNAPSPAARVASSRRSGACAPRTQRPRWAPAGWTPCSGASATPQGRCAPRPCRGTPGCCSSTTSFPPTRWTRSLPRAATTLSAPSRATV